MENHRHVTRKGGAGRKRVDGKAKTQSSATTVARGGEAELFHRKGKRLYTVCLLYTSPSPRDKRQSRMPSSA